MKNKIYQKQPINYGKSRKIVIHHTHLISNIINLLLPNDILFFDDCLYSQYLFIKSHIVDLQKLNIICILGFSTQIYRTTQIPIIENSAILHNRIHSNDIDAYGGFMTLNEINELLQFNNIYIAGHGAHHLELEKMNISKIMQTQLFIQDIKLMANDLRKINFTTDIFIFPYEYDNFPGSIPCIYSMGYTHIFANSNQSRIYIETLL